MVYINILKELLNKELYNKYNKVIDKEYLRNNFPEIYRLFLTLDVLNEHPSGINQYQPDDLEISFYKNYPNASKDIYAPLFSQLRLAKYEPALVEEYLLNARTREAASKLAFVALDVAEGKTSVEALRKSLDDFSDLAGSIGEILEGSEETFVSDDIEVLYENAVGAGGLRWRLKTLNRSLGPLRKGDFGFIFARPETGKTTFLASEATFMAGQLETPVLWINNEEQGEKVGLRCYEAALGAPLEQIIANRDRAKAAYYERTRRNIRIVDNASIQRNTIESLCEKFSPGLIVIDQLDKVQGFDGDREDLRMGAIYQWARELAKKYAPVIGVCQADGSGEGMKYLTMGNVSNAKTAKQAEADWIVGIGYSYDGPPNVRGLSICKNKLIGGEESIPKLRHAKLDVLIEPEIGRYRDMFIEENNK